MADPKDERDPTTYPTTYPTTHPTYDPNSAFIHMFRRAENRADFDGSLREEGRRINRETDQERAARLVENAGQDNPHLLGDVPPTPPRRLAAAAAVMQLPVRPWGRRIALPQEPAAGPSRLHVFLDNYEQQQLAQQQLSQQQLEQQQLAQQQLAQQQQQDDPIEASPPPKLRPRIQRLQGEDPKDPIVDSGGGKRKTKKLKRLKRLTKTNKRKNRRSKSRSRSRSRSKKSYSY